VETCHEAGNDVADEVRLPHLSCNMVQYTLMRMSSLSRADWEQRVSLQGRLCRLLAQGPGSS
jgi:hypothetical protein